jgi:cytochrome c peroxidase
MHNGVFNTLTEVVDFYNRRDVDGVIPEVNQNVDDLNNMGNLNLTTGEVQDLVAFMETLSDQ